MFNDIDTMMAGENSSPKGKAEQALLALLQTYPEAAKYLGEGALPYLQKIAETAVDPTVGNRASVTMKGINAGLGGK
jgi:hypothetical protein